MPEGTTDYAYRYGGQACRMTQVEYTCRARSPHSVLLKEAGEVEWVCTYEVEPDIHRIVQAGKSGGQSVPEVNRQLFAGISRG
ncbi:hypothetical protein C2W62_28805 [Candidatus Entotheonella serta]|nr:hypothetical protein C2W62_28805 [Candidatus Entotheonella serta]